jgi:MFS family permease
MAAELGETADVGTSSKNAWTVVTLACLGQFMVVLDVSIVNVALPAIRANLGFDATGLQWVVNAYALTFAGLLLLGGRAADIYGRKKIFLSGVGMFTVASLLGGLATTATLLVVARAAQGVGAAVLAPTTLTILTTTFSAGPARTKAIAGWSAVGAAGGAVGAVLGGVLTDYLSWRWILLINVPIGIGIVAAAIPAIKESHAKSHQDERPDESENKQVAGRGTSGQVGHRVDTRRLDVLGAILATGGITAVAYGTVRTHAHGWISPQTLVPLILGVVTLVVFFFVEARVTNPLVPLRLLRDRSVAAGNLLMLLMGIAFFTMWYFLSLHMQGDLGYSALRAGLAFVPHTTVLIVGSRVSARLLHRLGSRPLIISGALIAAAGFVWQAQMAPGYVTGVLLPGVVMCSGASLTFTPIVMITTSGGGHAEAGLVSGLLTTARQLGGSLGLAGLATVAAAAPTPVEGYGTVFLVGAAVLVASALATMVALPRPSHRR